VFAECTYPHYTPSGMEVPYTAWNPSQQIPKFPIFSNWLAHVENAGQNGPLSELTANWRVPDYSADQGNQVDIAFFDGLQSHTSTTFILQPILVGGRDWEIVSAMCCPKNNTVQGIPYGAIPGDVITGRIYGQNCDAGTGVCSSWTVSTLLTRNNSAGVSQ